MKLKYKYNVHFLTESYPTEEDALFDICVFLTEHDRMNEEWSDLGMKPAFHGSLRVNEDQLDKILTSLANMGYLQQREGAGRRKYYKLLKHDFGEHFAALSIR